MSVSFQSSHGVSERASTVRADRAFKRNAPGLALSPPSRGKCEVSWGEGS